MEPLSQLDSPARCCSLGDRPKLRRVHESVRCTEIYVIQRIEKFRAKLETHPFRHGKFTCQSQVQRLHPGTINSVSPGIAKGKGCRRRERCSVEPCIGGVRTRAKDRLTRHICTN